MDPFIGSIMVVGFNFPPKGWAFCNGQLLQISVNQALFSLFGTTYGGDGRSTFGLPNLQGRACMGYGSSPSGNYALGQTGGEPSHTLNIQEMPAHTHFWKATSQGPTTNIPTGDVLAGTAMYTGSSNGVMGPEIGSAGGNQAHENRSPFLVLNFLVALVGIYPSRS